MMIYGRAKSGISFPCLVVSVLLAAAKPNYVESRLAAPDFTDQYGETGTLCFLFRGRFFPSVKRHISWIGVPGILCSASKMSIVLESPVKQTWNVSVLNSLNWSNRLIVSLLYRSHHLKIENKGLHVFPCFRQ